MRAFEDVTDEAAPLLTQELVEPRLEAGAGDGVAAGVVAAGAVQAPVSGAAVAETASP